MNTRSKRGTKRGRSTERKEEEEKEEDKRMRLQEEEEEEEKIETCPQLTNHATTCSYLTKNTNLDCEEYCKENFQQWILFLFMIPSTTLEKKTSTRGRKKSNNNTEWIPNIPHLILPLSEEENIRLDPLYTQITLTFRIDHLTLKRSTNISYHFIWQSQSEHPNRWTIYSNLEPTRKEIFEPIHLERIFKKREELLQEIERNTNLKFNCILNVDLQQFHIEQSLSTNDKNPVTFLEEQLRKATQENTLQVLDKIGREYLPYRSHRRGTLPETQIWAYYKSRNTILINREVVIQGNHLPIYLLS